MPDFLLLDDYTVPGFGLTASLTLPIKDEDASGDSSSTSKAGKGKKGKKLDVKIKIRFKDEAKLTEFMALAEATSKGDGKLFTITNRVANAGGMRQGRFSGDLKVDPQDGLALWELSFSLAEHKSVSERAEDREDSPSVSAQQNGGSKVDASAAPDGSTAEGEQLDLLQRGLKKLEDWWG
ncbi:baseplate complex protein [Desulfovibrio falkowii]|uniref:Nucleoid DNA-binding protein n=1 Tax=Desulfovibrio falkowii TaxID=3136602 RepID=A0ABQ0EAL7_9BACT